jgi:hypothetical protein
LGNVQKRGEKVLGSVQKKSASGFHMEALSSDSLSES